MTPNWSANGVPFEPDYTNTDQKTQLEIDGNSRCHVTLSNSYSYFYYCDVTANGWAALSTDGGQGFLYLEATTLNGAVKDAFISIDPRSRWVATANSNVTIIGEIDLSQIDAPADVTITAVATESGTYTLASGGTLILKAS